MTDPPRQAFALFERDRLKRILAGAEGASPYEAQVLVRMAAAISIYGDKAAGTRAEEIRALADRIPCDTAIDLCRHHRGGLDSKEVPRLRQAVKDIRDRWRVDITAATDEGDSTSPTTGPDDEQRSDD
jgi:hypothetical protein